MNMKKTAISAGIGLALGGVSLSANAILTTSTTLIFTLGNATTVSCNYGTTPPCVKANYANTDVVGSYFLMDTNGNGPEAFEKTPIGSFPGGGIHIGTTQTAGGSHAGPINGTEVPVIDAPWTFFGNTGMHQTTVPVTVISSFGSHKTLDMSGWNVNWNGIASIPLVGTASIWCDTSTCSTSSNYTIDGQFHVAGAGFTTVAYFLHLEGEVTPHIPVPAAVWLFGSGLMGLVGVARRRKSKQA